MKKTRIGSLSLAALLTAVSFSVADSALAQNENASPTAHENANAEGAGAHAAAGAQTAGADDVGGPDGHSCGGLGHVDSQGVGHEDDECGELGINATGIDATSTGSSGRSNAVGESDLCSTEGLRPLIELFTEEHAAIVREADQAAIGELEGCVDVAGDTEVQSALADNDALLTALEVRGYSVSQVVAADARAEVPILYVAVPAED
jgi:uncharacterized membrane protein